MYYYHVSSKGQQASVKNREKYFLVVSLCPVAGLTSVVFLQTMYSIRHVML